MKRERQGEVNNGDKRTKKTIHYPVMQLIEREKGKEKKSRDEMRNRKRNEGNVRA